MYQIALEPFESERLPEPFSPQGRPRSSGKFFSRGKTKQYLRGVTYGPFRPDSPGSEYHDQERVARDFSTMARHGLNAIRIYTLPPAWLLDTAEAFGLSVLVGIPWEQHIAFLEDRRTAHLIANRIREGVSSLHRHPAILGYAVGNEIPAPIVRWYGRDKIEAFIRRLYLEAKNQDPEGLVTYVNYPTTEYLLLPFLDFVSFNVYLESEGDLVRYLERLQNLAGKRPLVMAEIGIDSRRHGLRKQARTLDWQIRTSFAAGCAGAFVFAWTDEWHRGGHDIEDWDFGLTDRKQKPKPALLAAGSAFASVPVPKKENLPPISVVVCVYNGEQTIAQCLEGTTALDYPNFEVIVIDDGSTDSSAAIASRYPVRLITTENQGLSAARNRGLQEARGSIVAYLDADAFPDPDWLTYLAHSFSSTQHAGVGGPNINPKSSLVQRCVSISPGNPTHVLLSDSRAEHIPGCNMAFRKQALQAVGGFDARFRIAGDDVDVCWKLQRQGWTLGFNAAAMVWHHARPTVKQYLKQQVNYGRAEALLERKWPQKYSRFGHVMWRGRIYGPAPDELVSRWRVYHGVWGTHLFQQLYPSPGISLLSISRVPEWVLVILGVALFSTLALFWEPMLALLLLLPICLGIFLLNGFLSARQALAQGGSSSGTFGFGESMLVWGLYLAQPMARLWGRLSYGLHPWKSRAPGRGVLPRPRTVRIWNEDWVAFENWHSSLETALQERRMAVIRGGDFDRWDLLVSAGMLGATRLFSTVEEHGAGKQLFRTRLSPVVNWKILWILPILVLGGALAAYDQAWGVAAALSGAGLVLFAKLLLELSAAMATVIEVLEEKNDG